MVESLSIGTKVVFTIRKLDYLIGLIISYNSSTDEYVVFSQYCNILSHIKSKNIFNLDDIEEVRNIINTKADTHISALQKQIKSVTSDEKNKEKSEKYNKLKTQIKTTAKNLSDSSNDDDFENKLKEICRLKNQIFSITLESAEKTRKENGRIKAEIRDIDSERKRKLSHISDEEIKKALSNWGIQ